MLQSGTRGRRVQLVAERCSGSPSSAERKSWIKDDYGSFRRKLTPNADSACKGLPSGDLWQMTDAPAFYSYPELRRSLDRRTKPEQWVGLSTD